MCAVTENTTFQKKLQIDLAFFQLFQVDSKSAVSLFTVFRRDMKTLVYFHLDSGLRQVDLQSHLLPHEDVRVPGFGEQSLQDVELGARKSGAFTSLLPGSRCTKK